MLHVGNNIMAGGIFNTLTCCERSPRLKLDEHLPLQPKLKKDVKDSPTEPYFIISDDSDVKNDEELIKMTCYDKYNSVTRKSKSSKNLGGAEDLSNKKEEKQSQKHIMVQSGDNIGKIEERRKIVEENQSQEHMRNFLKAMYDVKKQRKLNKKLIALAQKVYQPGVEEKLRHKIEKYLKSVPSAFSDGDEDGKEFRQKLPYYFIEYLKKIFHENYADDAENETLNDTGVAESIESVIRPWIKTIPMNIMDPLNRPIEKEEFLQKIVQKLKPHLYHRPMLKTGYKYLLSSHIIEILNEMPINVGPEIKSEYIQMICKNLVKKLFCMQIDRCREQKEMPGFHANSNDNTNIGKPTVQQTKELVEKQLVKLFNKIGKPISKRRAAMIGNQITGILVDSNGSPEIIDYKVRKELKATFKSTGLVSDYQSQYFSQKIINHFKDEIINETYRNNNYFKTDREAYFLNCYQDKNDSIKYGPKSSSTNIHQDNFKSYEKQVYEQVQCWLEKFELCIPLVSHKSFKEMVVTELATEIVLREKYLNNLSIQRSASEEFEMLEYNIYKWLRKLVGEDLSEVIDNVPDLIMKIQSVPKPNSIKLPLTNEIQDDFQSAMHFPFEKLCEEIFLWCKRLPEHLFNEHHAVDKRVTARQLTENIESVIGKVNFTDDIIEHEILSWFKNTFNTLPNQSQFEDIQCKIKEILHTMQSSCEPNVVINYDLLQTIDTASDIENNTDRTLQIDDYCKELPKLIDRWLINILPNFKETELRRIVVAGLAEDIADRFRFLEKNPASCGKFHDELEHLKYHIFKRMRYLLGDENLAIIEHATDLMQKIQLIRAPKPHIDDCGKRSKGHTLIDSNSCCLETNVFIRDQQRNISRYTTKNRSDQESASDQVVVGRRSSYFSCTDSESQIGDQKIVNEGSLSSKNNEPCEEIHDKNKIKAPVRLSNPSGYVAGPLASKTSPSDPSGTMTSKATQNFPVYVSEVRSGPANPKKSGQIGQTSSQTAIGEKSVRTLNQILVEYDEIIKHQVKELPIDDSTEDRRVLGEQARKAVYNGIWKTYVTLKSDPVIENDYSLFEQILEEHLDISLDCFPQTVTLKCMRAMWKQKVTKLIMDMLKQVHSATERPSFREQLTEKFNRKFIKSRDQKISDHVLEVFISNAADAYIVYSRYQLEDPVKANIYRLRLMKRLEELVEHTKRFQNLEFRHVDTNLLLQEALNILGEVPLPDSKELKEEANEIMYIDEIESWYCKLPVKPIKNVLDDILRNRMREMLARRLIALEKQLGRNNQSLNEKMYHEVVVFLENNAELRENEDLNIHFMAGELTNRLRNMNCQMQTPEQSTSKYSAGQSQIAGPSPTNIRILEDQMQSEMPIPNNALMSQCQGSFPTDNHRMPLVQPQTLGRCPNNTTSTRISQYSRMSNDNSGMPMGQLQDLGPCLKSACRVQGQIKITGPFLNNNRMPDTNQMGSYDNNPPQQQQCYHQGGIGYEPAAELYDEGHYNDYRCHPDLKGGPYCESMSCRRR